MQSPAISHLFGRVLGYMDWMNWKKIHYEVEEDYLEQLQTKESVEELPPKLRSIVKRYLSDEEYQRQDP